jgi:hypothetical protein
MGSAKVENLFLCKNHLCPICSIKRANDEKVLTQSVLEKLDSCFFGTFTIKTGTDWEIHKRELLQIWNSYTTRIKNHFKRKFGIQPAIIRGLDFTLHPYEVQNEGLHFHIHCLIGFEKDFGVQPEEIADYLNDSWINTARKRGNDCSRKGQKVLIVKSKKGRVQVGAYVNKSITSNLGQEIVAIHKNGSGLFDGRMGFGRFMAEVITARDEDRERLKRFYKAICKFLRGTKWTSKNKLWRELQEEQEPEVEEDPPEEQETRVIEFDKDAGRLLLESHSRNLIAYCKRLVLWGDKEQFEDFQMLVSIPFADTMFDAYEDDLERREVFLGMIDEHFHKFRVQIGEEDKGKIHFVR